MVLDYAQPPKAKTGIHWPWILTIIGCCGVEVGAATVAIFRPNPVYWFLLAAPWLLLVLAILWRFIKSQELS